MTADNLEKARTALGLINYCIHGADLINTQSQFPSVNLQKLLDGAKGNFGDLEGLLENQAMLPSIKQIDPPVDDLLVGNLPIVNQPGVWRRPPTRRRPPAWRS